MRRFDWGRRLAGDYLDGSGSLKLTLQWGPLTPAGTLVYHEAFRDDHRPFVEAVLTHDGYIPAGCSFFGTVCLFHPTWRGGNSKVQIDHEQHRPLLF